MASLVCDNDRFCDATDSVFADTDTQSEKMLEDARWLTNTNKFFPDLVWKKVMDKLTKRSSIENCSNASLFFRNMLEEKRTIKVLLPAVFRMLAERYCDMVKWCKSYRNAYLESNFWNWSLNEKEPHRMAGIWNCRLVCKSWNRSVEDLFRNAEAGHYIMPEDWLLPESYFGLHSYANDTFFHPEQFERFLNHFEVTHFDSVNEKTKKCPFLGRSVRIQFIPCDNQQVHEIFFDRLIKLLKKFGKEVWFFECEVDSVYLDKDPSVARLKMYRKCRDMVTLMPNLKVLRIIDRKPGQASAEMVYDLEQEISSNPFPQLACLELIKTFKIPGPFCNHLVNQNPQIWGLSVYDTDFQENCMLFMVELPNLKKLHLRPITIDAVVALEHCTNNLGLESFSFDLWQLQQFVPWSRIFKMIESKVNPYSCTELKLKMPNPRTNEERKLVLEETMSYRLKLPNIQYFGVFSHTRFCVDFLLPLRNRLSLLRTQFKNDFEDLFLDEFQENQVIKFLGFEVSMEHSNIGKELSRLKDISVFGGLNKSYFIRSNRIVKTRKVKQ